jgi:hypothetical protein
MDFTELGEICTHMPISVKHIDERHGLFSKASGLLTGTELLWAIAGVNTSGLKEKPVLYTFLDMDDITGVEISTAHLREAAELAITGSHYQGVARLVAICARGDLPFALARMWMVFAEVAGWETLVFRGRSEAVAWLRELTTSKFGIQLSLDLDAEGADPGRPA